jgi:transposase
MKDEPTDQQWARLLPLLPPQKPSRGRPANDHRTVVNAILWILRTEAPWRDLPADAGVCWKTAASRFYRWTASGIWQMILDERQRDADQEGEIDWSKHFVDGSSVRAHQHAAGARGSSREDEALGRSRGGFTSKIHLKAEGDGKPLTFLVTAEQRHEATMFEPLLEMGAAKRAARGRPRLRPQCVVADKGYNSERIRELLNGKQVKPVIPVRSDQDKDESFDQEMSRDRNLVERLINRLKQWRRIATRYEKRAVNYGGMLTLAAMILWL